ncbi:hypothetical protein WT27_14795 [Burkholderia territorii]|uniref:Flagellar motor switch protein FliN-like C-terminal domain-containing protein n=1 Tax=Burkholderia territorii TaxID=1503055 RepID=A0A125A8S8_9BURK|nr:hypothetical protein WT27_14795 [Burkholderia territorii]KVX26260.1 hypothetical protein WT31_16720 [Burkholderia territorii]
MDTYPNDVLAGKTSDSHDAFRLPCIDTLSAVEFDVLNRLIALSGRRIGFRTVEGVRSMRCERAMRVALDISGVRTIVYLAGRREDDQHGWYAFDHLAPAQRAALWALRANRLRRAFEQLFSAPVTVRDVIRDIVPPGWLRMSLRIGRIEVGCWFDAASAAGVLAASQPQRRPVLPALSFFPVGCLMTLRAVYVSRDEYQGLASGDVVVIARDATAPLRGELIAPGFGFHFAMTYRTEGTVTIETDEIRLDTQDVPTELDDRQVELSIELATCRLTLGELANLTAGQMMRLAKAADEMSVNIRYRGTYVARGRLIEINGLLGVRIDAIGKDAST